MRNLRNRPATRLESEWRIMPFGLNAGSSHSRQAALAVLTCKGVTIRDSSRTSGGLSHDAKGGQGQKIVVPSMFVGGAATAGPAPATSPTTTAKLPANAKVTIMRQDLTMFKRARTILIAFFAVSCMLFFGTVPATAASTDGADVVHQSVCQPYGTSTICVTYHSVINDVWTPSGVHAYTQDIRYEVTYTSAAGEFLYSFANTFQNQFVFAKGESQVNVAHFTFETVVPGYGTCRQDSDIVYSNGEVRFINGSYTCR